MAWQQRPLTVTLGELATPFVVPPINLAVLAGLCLIAGRRAVWRMGCGLALACLLLLALPVVANALIAALEQGQAAGDPAGAQAIVVLGAEVTRLADGQTVPGPLSLRRLRTAAAVARRTALPLLVSGGVTQAGAAPVAAAMAASLRDDFARPARWVEDRSADTFDNACDSAAMLALAGIGTVLVVTDAWHMRRAMLAFRATSLRAIPAPVPPQAEFGLELEDFIPAASAWMRSYFALHEWIGLGWYAVRPAPPACPAGRAAS